jgi:hypothetical protein
MFPRNPRYEFVILAIMCTVAIFLFPTARGHYSAVHGPVTTLLSLPVKLRIWLGMALAALRVSGCMQYDSFAELRLVWQTILLPQAVPPGTVAVLRC